MIGVQGDITFEGDRGRDHDDRGRDHDDRDGGQSSGKAFERKPGYQYARNYPDPITGHPLQLYPSRQRDEFDSSEDHMKYLDAVSRWNNYLPPRRPIPKATEYGEPIRAAVPPAGHARRPALRSRHVGLRLTERDFELLDQLARAHAVRPGTMARMLVVRAVRAAADEPER